MSLASTPGIEILFLCPSACSLISVQSGIFWLCAYIIFSVGKKNQLDVTFCILYFSSNSCSTYFGQPCAHHQELMTA